MDPMLGSRTFAVGFPAALRPYTRLLWTNSGRRQQRLPRLGPAATGAAAAGLGAVAVAAAGGWPPLQATLLSGAGYYGGGNGDTFMEQLRDPARRLTNVLIALNTVFFGLQVFTGGPLTGALTLWCSKINPLIAAGQWWRLLTAAFLHGDIVHLGINCSSLNTLGPMLEARMGRGRFLVTYLLAAVCGNLASFLLSTSPAVGASGAIFGVGGALAVYYYRNQDLVGKQRADRMLQQLKQTLVINLLYGFMNSRIDNWGHIGGMLGGALVAFLLGPCYVVGALPGRRGQYLLDKPPLPVLRSGPIQL